MIDYFLKLKKISQIIQSKALIRAALKGVAATTEHFAVLKNLKRINTVIDIGANKGQFSLASRLIYPHSKIFSFEPLEKPAKMFETLFRHDEKVVLFRSALGTKKTHSQINISKRDDSSSLLDIGKNQTSIFPGTERVRSQKIEVAPLSFYLKKTHLEDRTLMKIDVQGYELEVLKGSSDLLQSIFYVYVECSFVELYDEQPLANDVINFLEKFSFILKGVYNPHYDKDGIVVQADFLFEKL